VSSSPTPHARGIRFARPSRSRLARSGGAGAGTARPRPRTASSRAGRRGWRSRCLGSCAPRRRAHRHQKKGAPWRLDLAAGTVKRAWTTPCYDDAIHRVFFLFGLGGGRPAGRVGLLAAVQAKIPISPAPTDAIIGSLFHADSVMVRLGR
jgi:hypothetical protein